MGYYSDNYNETVKSVLGELDKALGAVDRKRLKNSYRQFWKQNRFTS